MFDDEPGVRTRKRIQTWREPRGWWGFQSPTTGARYDFESFVQTRETTTDRHPTGWAERNKLLGKESVKSLPPKTVLALRRNDYGGFFLTEKQAYECKSTIFGKQFSQGTTVYYSNVPTLGQSDQAITPTSTIWPVLGSADLQELYGLGSTAIAAVMPSQPAESVSTILGELREGLPRLTRRFASLQESANSTASNYIAYEFGVKPMVSDVVSVTRSLQRYDQILAKLERASGDLLHRTYTFQDETSTTQLSSGTAVTWPQPATQVSPGSGVKTTSLISYKKTWFTGAFSFYFERARGAVNQLMTFLQQFGVAPSADTFWNLTPYSWLLDWFANFGDVVFNATYLHQNNQVMNYGYLMQTTILTKRVEWHGGGSHSIQDFTVSRKVRLKASPFGFGLKYDDLDTRQKAILVALGITRAT